MRRDLRQATYAVLGALSIALGARLEFELPGAAAPQTAQTLAVLLTGCVLGPVWGVGAVALYLAAGAFGLPVFADGRSGLAVLWGPTAGYLAGFVVAAWLAGAWTHGLVGRHSLAGRHSFAGRHSSLGRRPLGALAGMLLAHAVILAQGWLRLSIALGPAQAFAAGVAPFLVGGAVKSALAAVVCVVMSRRTEPTAEDPSDRNPPDRDPSAGDPSDGDQ